MPEPAERVVDARPMPQNRIDPDVKLPPSVRAAAEAAEALHKAAYSPPAEPQPEPSTPPVAAEPAPPAPEVQPTPVPAPAPPPPQPVVDDPTVRAPFDPNIDSQGYYHRYISMQGRWRGSQDEVTRLRTEVQAIGDELIRTQQMLASQPPPPYQNGHAAPPPTPPPSLITPHDEQQFGTEVIDLARRVARETLAPELQSLRGENEQLRTQLQRTGKQGLFATLDERVPKWREINVDPSFKRWLSLPDIYSGGVRQRLLDAAVAAADAPRVVAFFTGFLREAAQGQPSQPQPAPSPAEPPPAARQPPLSLEALAAPGRARPAPGEQPAVGDKPVYTRAQISKFYADVRRGAYAGRETEKSAIERDIFAAQTEGRVR